MAVRDDLEWARGLAARGAWVLHADARVIGQVQEVFDGVEKRWMSGGEPVAGPVILLKNGHALVAKAGAFVELGAQDAVFAQEFQAALAGTIALSVARARELGIRRGVGVHVICAAMRAQLAQIERALPRRAAASAPIHEDQAVEGEFEQGLHTEG